MEGLSKLPSLTLEAVSGKKQSDLSPDKRLEGVLENRTRKDQAQSRHIPSKIEGTVEAHKTGAPMQTTVCSAETNKGSCTKCSSSSP